MSNKTKAIIVPDDVEYNPQTKSLVVTKPAPLELTYTEARKLMKQLRPPPSQKQIDNGKKLGELSKARWQKIREEKSRKEAEAQSIAQRQQLIAEKEGIKYKNPKNIIPQELITIKPKKQYKPREKKPEYNYNDDPTEEEYEEEVIVYEKPKKKKIVKKIVAVDSDDDNDDKDDRIQNKVKKATKTIETINKLDSAISQLKSSNPYASAFARIKF
jgi:hypothetical protein